jgi:uncharacterized membrane protein YfcA
VNWRTFRRLAVAGVIGGVTGAYVLTELPEKPVKVFVTVYLFGMALLILHRIIKGSVERKLMRGTVPIGVAGGFLDAIGGGGWGPMVNSTLIARGEAARISIGWVSLAEFLVTAAISATFVMTLDLASYGQVVLGLIIGGALAAPFAGWFSRVLPQPVLMSLVALTVSGLGVYNFVQLGST